MIGTQYTVATPHGSFVAMWDEDEDRPVMYSGSEEAMGFFKAFFELTSVIGRDGALLSLESLEPDDLYGFCQSPEFGILVLPEAGDMLSLMLEEQQGADQSSAALDSAGGEEEASRLLTKLNTDGDESGALRQRLAELLPTLSFDSDDDRDAFVEAAGLDTDPVFDAIGGAPVAHADASVLPMDQSVKVIVQAAQDYAIKHFAGSRVTNDSDGSEIILDKGGIIHGLSARAGLTDALVATDLKTLLKMMTFMRKEPDRKGRADILAAYRYGAVVEVQGKSVQVGVIVREHRDGKRYYDHYELKPRNQ